MEYCTHFAFSSSIVLFLLHLEPDLATARSEVIGELVLDRVGQVDQEARRFHENESAINQIGDERGLKTLHALISETRRKVIAYL